ncbi:unnamed protein product [Echinostoma caproni]|uniref:Similar to n=1 Tax=Echinostoma caproni TaxID=27848 RepID=A0A183BEZ1_9TREM|nr:unnamed protein product [Echinostoma caproni]
MELSFTNSNNSTPTKRPVKRLTNYDARLIAEANLLPPVPSRRQRYSQSSQSAEIFADSIEEDRFQIRATRSLRLTDVVSSSKQANASLTRSGRLISNIPAFSGDTDDALTGYSLRSTKRSQFQAKSHSVTLCSSRPELSTPGDLSPHPSDYHESHMLEAVPDSTSDIASEPPQIYPILAPELDEELVTCGDRFFVSDMDQSCSTTPLRTDPMDDSDLSGDPAGASHACSFASYATEPLDYIYSDHDYIRHTAHETKLNTNRLVHSLPLPLPPVMDYPSDIAHPVSTVNHFLTSTPPPPVLHPATPPGLHLQDPTTSPNHQKIIFSPQEHRLFPLPTPNSCPTKPAAFWAVSTPSARVKSSKRHLLPFEQRLTVTLKRIGPQSYQISHPDEVYVSQ